MLWRCHRLDVVEVSLLNETESATRKHHQKQLVDVEGLVCIEAATWLSGMCTGFCKNLRSGLAVCDKKFWKMECVDVPENAKW